eukprot:gene2259-biopygen1869
MSTSHCLLSAPIPPPQGAAPLPVPPLLEGIVDFAELRDVGAAYVDKTSTISKLAQRRQRMYLSRPDGFGKSVLLSTLKYYFEGRADLFEGLAVGEAMASRAVAQRPVLHLQMEEMGSSIVKLEQNLTDWLITHEARYKIQVVPETGSMRVRLKKIIERAFEESKTAMDAHQGGTPSFPGVVVLIDNFHTPLVKSLGTPDERAVRELYDSLFYSLFQNSQVYFLLATGTLSLDHLRNHLRISAPPNDVSTKPEWSDVCGFSIKEIRETFAAHLEVKCVSLEVSADSLLSALEQHCNAHQFCDAGSLLYSHNDVLEVMGMTEKVARSARSAASLLYRRIALRRTDTAVVRHSQSSDFSDMVHEGSRFVDKTEWAWHIANRLGHSHIVFMRPRRFGKTTLASTMKHYYEGRKELFVGLKAAELESKRLIDEQWVRRPVLFLSMDIDFSDEPSFRNSVLNRLEPYCKMYNAPCSEAKPLNQIFIDLILAAQRQTGHRPVIIIDEFQWPTLKSESLDETVRTKIQEAYIVFLGALKKEATNIHRTFITGIVYVKFLSEKGSSLLNHLTNTTFDPVLSTACGFTEEEMRATFPLELERLYDTPELAGKRAEDSNKIEVVMNELRERFNGYRFSPDPCAAVYNPWSVMQSLSKQAVAYYWAGEGPSSAMLQLLKNNDVGYLKELRRKTISRESLLNNALIHTQDIGSTPLYALYCGYLTLLDASAQDGTLPTECAIDFPNKEVRLAVALLELKIKYGMQCVPTFLLQLPTLAARGDVAQMMTFFYHFIADAYGGTDKSFFDVESYYQVRLYDLLKCCFKEANVERPVITGRIDVNFVVNDHATGKRREYILELKMTHRGKKAAAIKQVRRYTPRATSSEWVRLVLFFNKDLRNLSDWVQVSDTGHIIAQINDQQREIFNRKSAATDTPEGSSSARGV